MILNNAQVGVSVPEIYRRNFKTPRCVFCHKPTSHWMDKKAYTCASTQELLPLDVQRPSVHRLWNSMCTSNHLQIASPNDGTW